MAVIAPLAPLGFSSRPSADEVRPESSSYVHKVWTVSVHTGSQLYMAHTHQLSSDTSISLVALRLLYTPCPPYLIQRK